eukprot:768424-Hanusia_phi.AAC.6
MDYEVNWKAKMQYFNNQKKILITLIAKINNWTIPSNYSRDAFLSILEAHHIRQHTKGIRAILVGPD